MSPENEIKIFFRFYILFHLLKKHRKGKLFPPALIDIFLTDCHFYIFSYPLTYLMIVLNVVIHFFSKEFKALHLRVSLAEKIK